MVVHYRKTIFSIDGSELQFAGWTAGEKWNGWACPRFEKNEALKVMEDYNKNLTTDEEQRFKILYNEEKDLFYMPEWDVHSMGEYDEDNEYKGAIINTFEGPVKVYSLGAGFWVWDDLSEHNDRVNNGVLLTEEV